MTYHHERGGGPSIPRRILDRLAATASREVGVQGDAVLFQMAREKTIADYAKDHATEFRERWHEIEQLLLDQPLDSFRLYESGYLDEDQEGIYIPPHLVITFQRHHVQDGQEMVVRTYIHGLETRPCSNSDWYGDEVDTVSLGQQILWLDMNRKKHLNAEDILKKKPFKDPETGLNAEREGFRNFRLSAESQREYWKKVMLRQRDELLESVNYYYIVMTAGNLDTGFEDQELLYETGVGRVDFEPGWYENYLPRWENFTSEAFITHPVFTRMSERTDFYEHMERELPRCLPNRRQSYDDVANVLELVEGSAAVSAGLGITCGGLYGEQRHSMMWALDFLASADKPYNRPYGDGSYLYFPGRER